jgi:hypothetical protein
MKKTRLMSKLFSDSTPEEYKEVIAEKVDEAMTEGEASYTDEDGEDLVFQKVDDDVMVADHTNGDDEVEITKVSTNPEDENDLVMEPVETEVVEDKQTPEGGETEITTATESKTEDPIKLCPETHMFYIEGKEDKYPTYEEAKKALEGTKETKTESEDQNLKSVQINVLPGEGTEPEADLVDDLEVEIDPDVVGTQRYSLRFKNFSEKKARMIAKLFAESAKALVEACNCDVDEDVKVDFKGDKMKVMSVTIGKKSRTFSEAEEDEPKDEPTAEPTAEPTDEPTAEPKDETKTESETDPKVTVTIENLEPASVGDLLNAGHLVKMEDTEHMVNPNDSDFTPKQFSLNDRKQSINPLLTTEMY